MSNIKFRLEKWENNLVFQILEMNEKWRNSFEFQNNKNTIFKRVESVSEPQLIRDIVYLRGSDLDLDFVVSSMYFPSKEECDTAYNEIISLLKEASDHWDKYRGFDKKVEINSNIFEF
jgi:hypothetical protein